VLSSFAAHSVNDATKLQYFLYALLLMLLLLLPCLLLLFAAVLLFLPAPLHNVLVVNGHVSVSSRVYIGSLPWLSIASLCSPPPFSFHESTGKEEEEVEGARRQKKPSLSAARSKVVGLEEEKQVYDIEIVQQRNTFPQ